MSLLQKIVNRLDRLVGWLRSDGRPRIEPFRVFPSDIPAEERSRSDLHRLFYENDQSIVHKWLHYIEIYDQEFQRYRETDVRVLEIGVFRGGSLRMWRKYFGDKATIFGVDIDKWCSRYDGESASVRVGSQDDAVFLKKVVSEMGGIDIVIDDGSHICNHQKESFGILFPLLSDNGIYVCEDTHSSYWRGFHKGGFRRKGSFIEYSKRLIDDIHHEFHRRGRMLARPDTNIKSISFYNSMVVFHKAKPTRASHVKIGVEDRPV